MKWTTRALLFAVAALTVPVVCQAEPRFITSPTLRIQSSLQNTSKQAKTGPTKNQQPATKLSRRSLRQPASTSDRFGSGTIRPTGGVPDLTVSSISFRGRTAYVTVANRGTKCSPITDVRVLVRRRSDNRVVADKKRRVAALNSRGSQVYAFESLPLDDVHVFATVDSAKQVSEQSESNNSKRLTVGAQSAPSADLSIQFLIRDRGGVTAVVTNRGRSTTPATDCLVTVRRDSDGAVIRRVSKRVAEIAPGKTQRINVQAAQVAGTTVTAKVDPNGRVRELNENNNTKTARFSN